MKKYYILFILIIIIIFMVQEEKYEAVFETDNIYEIYYLDFRNSNLNTNNFNDYFNDETIDVLKITPHISEIYVNKFNFDEYLFDYSSYNSNIKKFKDSFLEQLKLINYDDYESAKINGIKIDMVKVFANKNSILKILKSDKNVKYVFNYHDYLEV